VRTLILDSICSSPYEQQRVIQQLTSMPFFLPVDFVFDLTNQRLALAIDFESHPVLAETLSQLPSTKPQKLVGGRFGRTIANQLATSEWSGHYGEVWNEESRTEFVRFMQSYGILIQHRAWHSQQTANDVG